MSWSVQICGWFRLLTAFRFTLEAFTQVSVVGEVFGKDFDGYGAVQTGVGGAIHLSHTTGTELVGDFEEAESLSCP